MTNDYPYPPVSHEPHIQELYDRLREAGHSPFPIPLGIKLNESDRLNSACIRCEPSMPRFAIWLLIFAWTFPSLRSSASVEVKAIEMTVSDLPPALTFYSGVLQFRQVTQNDEAGIRSAQLMLGEESLILHSYALKGSLIPENLPSNDLSFQHLAILVGDMKAAYQHLLRHQVKIVSTAPQRLPDWNWDAAQICALYFRNPDGHFLELIQFPSDKGEPKWHRPSEALFRGIDHSAVVVSDMKRSRHFYRDTIGLTISGESLNYGPEQDRLSSVTGTQVRITSFLEPRVLASSC